MMYDKFQLPKAVETHFRAVNEGDPKTFLSIFTENAVVIDSGNVYRGKIDIKEWGNHTYFDTNLSLKVINAVHNTNKIVVTAKCDGDYNKNGLPDPLFLDFHFTMDEDKITRLYNVISSNSRAIPLPHHIAAFYHASDIYDDNLLAECFSEDAILMDEGETYLGPQAVSGHILEANRGAKVLTDITHCVEKNGETIVTAIISGDFDGSPIPLDFRFIHKNDKIKKLNIIVSGE